MLYVPIKRVRRSRPFNSFLNDLDGVPNKRQNSPIVSLPCFRYIFSLSLSLSGSDGNPITYSIRKAYSSRASLPIFTTSLRFEIPSVCVATTKPSIHSFIYFLLLFFALLGSPPTPYRQDLEELLL